MLSSVPPIKIDSTTDSMAIGEGAGALLDADDGSNIAIGTDALSSTTDADSGADANIAIGSKAGEDITGGDNNVLIGHHAGKDQTTADDNVYIGRSAGAAGNGSNNIAVGSYAFDAADGGEAYNILIGKSAGGDINTDDADYNIAIGFEALKGGTSVDGNNIAIGANVMNNASFAGDDCIAIGHDAMQGAVTSAADGAVAVGFEALKALTVGTKNAAVGYQALAANADGESNTAFGYQALAANVDGNSNTAIGADTMKVFEPAEDSGGNTAVGFAAMSTVSTGVGNTAVGSTALHGLTSANGNTAVGYDALSADCGEGNTVMGRQAAPACTGTLNTAVGYLSMYTSTAVDNCATLGYGSLYTANDESLDRSVAIGFEAAYHNNSQNGAAGASAITAVGYRAARYLGTIDNGSSTAGNVGITAIGYLAMSGGETDDVTNNTASYSVGVGHYAGGGLAAGGTADHFTAGNGVYVGYSAAANLTSGNANTAIGNSALTAATSGGNNTALGYRAMGSAQAVSDCVAIGSNALYTLNDDSGNACVAIGHEAAYSAVGLSGASNEVFSGTYVGGYAGKYLGDTDNNYNRGNTAIGFKTLIGGDTSTAANNTTVYSTAVGAYAGGGTSTSALTATGGVYLGYYAGTLVSSGDYNVCIGYASGDELADATKNILIGADSGGTMTNNVGNVVIGHQALDAADSGENYNVAIGHQAMSTANDPEYDYNIAIGYQALMGGTHVDGQRDCIAIGSNTLDTADNEGYYNIAMGKGAMGTGIVSADDCIGIGRLALEDNTSGQNIGIGYQAGTNLTAGDKNVALGYQALGSQSTGDRNIAIGMKALYQCTNSDNEGDNVAIGHKAGEFIGDAEKNIAIGTYALESVTGTPLTGQGNVGVGWEALTAVITDAQHNTAVGYEAGESITTGDFNICIGSRSGENIATGSNNVMLGFHLNASAADVTHEIVIGAGADVSNDFDGAGTETCRIGRASDYITVDFGENATWSHSSDIRIKKDISDNELGLDFINGLRTVSYKKKAPSEYPKEFKGYDPNETERKNPNRIHYGFIAQEVKEAMDKVGHSNFPMWSENKDSMQELAEAELITPLVKAVQELSEEMEKLKSKCKCN